MIVFDDDSNKLLSSALASASTNQTGSLHEAGEDVMRHGYFLTFVWRYDFLVKSIGKRGIVCVSLGGRVAQSTFDFVEMVGFDS